jgi:hypothetical protein
MTLKPNVVVAVLFGFLLVMAQSPASVENQSQFSYQVGALGDDASRRNLGVAADIETHVYDSYPGVFDYFWVGNNLADGSFIQFGYGIEPGYFCLNGVSVAGKFTCLGSTEQILDSDGRWQWQYWPSREGHDFRYQIGPAGSAGANSTWHEYKIVPTLNNHWAFELDGVNVATVDVRPQLSSDAAFIVAEKFAASSDLAGKLGPVQFANLSYLAPEGWHSVDSLVSFGSCNQNSACPMNLYGVSSTRQNFTLAGSGVSGRASGSLLWTNAYLTLAVNVHQNVKFYVSFLSQQQSFQGNALVPIPKGMYAYVTIPAANGQNIGPLSIIGAGDQFAGWTGDIHSDNLTVRVLMNSDKQVSAVWQPQLLAPVILIVTISAIVAISLLVNFRRSKSP